MRTLFLSILIISSAYGNDVPKECLQNPMFGYFYRQQEYSTSSHQEDMILAKLGNRYAESLLSVLRIREFNSAARDSSEEWIIKNCAPYVHRISANKDDLAIKEDFLSEEEFQELAACRVKQNSQNYTKLKCELNKIIRKSPVRVKTYTKNFNKVIEDYEKSNNQKVFISRHHQWDKSQKRTLIKQFPGAAVASKLLTTLALGATARYMMTPMDSDLRAWIKEQPMASLLPEDLLKKSLELQEGDLYKAILSIENVLSEYWLLPDRDKLRQTSALKSITNTCNPAKEDIFGSYYHLFGTMLLGCVQNPILATLIGKVESLGGRILDIKKAKRQGHNIAYHLIRGTDPQEEKINSRGGRIGHRICKKRPKSY